MMANYRMTPARRRALKKAQLASARKRRRSRPKVSRRTRAKIIGKAVAYGAIPVVGLVAYSEIKGSNRRIRQETKRVKKGLPSAAGISRNRTSDRVRYAALATKNTRSRQKTGLKPMKGMSQAQKYDYAVYRQQMRHRMKYSSTTNRSIKTNLRTNKRAKSHRSYIRSV